MQKIIINNFGAIKNADVEIRKVLVLIGEQASGKSTIAKLIYFFKSLRDDLFNQVYKAQKEDFDKLEDLIYLIRNKFYDYFGSTLHLPDFSITYYYSDKKNIKLSLDARKRLIVNVDSFLNYDFTHKASQIKKILVNGNNSNNTIEQLAFEQDKLQYAKRLSKLINELFESNQTNSLYVIDGRNSTISYSNLFENYFFADLQNKLLEQSKLSTDDKLKRKTDEKTSNESLMLSFIERVLKLKDTFKKFGNFEGLIESYADDDKLKQKLVAVRYQIDKILRGKYLIDNFGEKIFINETTNEYVYLSNASSGQKESIRILQDIFMNILENPKFLRIVEEPEAHLFPVAQKQLIELLSLMANQNQDNQLIITTHSPYVLTVFNNLLFAKRVVEKNPSAEIEVTEIIGKDYWLAATDFAAYSLSNSALDIDNYCESIFSTEKGTIRQNFLDTVSEMLGGDFNTLYQIHAKTFARK